MFKALIAEGLGTFILVLAGTGAVIVNDVYGGIVGHLGIALAFGFTVMAVIYAYGSVSGAHINPAVTIAFWLAGRFPASQVMPYVVVQILGAILASTLLRVSFPAHESLGATALNIAVFPGFLIELIMSWWLMTVILRVSQGAREEGFIAGVIIGSVVGIEALVGGPITGASMNPARSIGPAIVSGNVSELWLYIIAPIMGTGIAVLSCSLVSCKSCCSMAAVKN